MLEQRLVHVPGLAAVVGSEEDSRVPAEPELRVPTGLDVPGRVELQTALLREAELLGPLPRVSLVVGTMDRRAVEEVVRRRVQRFVARVDDCVVDAPAR
jgi:hypothetical protein